VQLGVIGCRARGAVIEPYPLSLHELERDDAMRMKHKELVRMAPTLQPAVPVR